MSLILDRMELADVGANPERLATAIHLQLGVGSGPVPVHDIARALDIVDIREEPLRNMEAALLTDPERSHGAILLNSTSRPQRRRFSLGHELGHFVNEYHRPTSVTGFQCARSDMIEARDINRHVRQEAEANRFSIELLTPRKRLKPYLRGDVSLDRAEAIANDFDISRQAAARRYVQLHDASLAVLFCRLGRVQHIDRSEDGPHLVFWVGDALPETGPDRPGVRSLIADEWISSPLTDEVTVDVHQQADGWVTVLIQAEYGNGTQDNGTWESPHL